jgi:hypothetical protein
MSPRRGNFEKYENLLRRHRYTWVFAETHHRNLSLPGTKIILRYVCRNTPKSHERKVRLISLLRMTIHVWV